jgi:hypothetical protein
MTFDTVCSIGLQFPNVEETSGARGTALTVGGKMIACPAIHKSAEANSIVVRIGVEQRAELIDADPKTYYITDHYLPYPSVLVRLSRIHPDALRDLLGMSLKFVSAKRRK